MKLHKVCKVQKFEELDLGVLFIADSGDGKPQYSFKAVYKAGGAKPTEHVVVLSHPDYSGKPGLLSPSFFENRIVVRVDGAVVCPHFENRRIITLGYTPEVGDLYLSHNDFAWICVGGNGRQHPFVNIQTGEILGAIPPEGAVIKEWSVKHPTLTDHDQLFAVKA